MINSCVRCGAKLKGFFKICALCQREVDLINARKRVIVDRENPENEEGKKK